MASLSFNQVTLIVQGLQLCTPDSYVHVLSNNFFDSYGWDSKEDISDAEQLPVPSRKRNDDQQNSWQFTGADVYKSGLIAIFRGGGSTLSLVRQNIVEAL